MQKIYSYPVDECLSDGAEQAHDPWKLVREENIIRVMASFAWKNAMDFGTGSGRYLKLLASVRSISGGGALFAVEPDRERIKAAKKNVRGMEGNGLAFEFVSGSIDAARSCIHPNTLDLVLCSQVFPHVPRKVFTETLDGFAEMLIKGGVGIIAVPFHCLKKISGDYFHVVNLRSFVSPYKAFRTLISPEEFDRMAKKPQKGLLPVRAFKIPQMFQASAGSLPYSVFAPAAFSNLKKFSVETCLVYSIHLYGKEGTPRIGDIILKLRRKQV